MLDSFDAQGSLKSVEGVFLGKNGMIDPKSKGETHRGKIPWDNSVVPFP